MARAGVSGEGEEAESANGRAACEKRGRDAGGDGSGQLRGESGEGGWAACELSKEEERGEGEGGSSKATANAGEGEAAEAGEAGGCALEASVPV
jgi:hypothetical protein